MKEILFALGVCLCLGACDMRTTSDQIQQRQQELILQEGTAVIGMPAVTRFARKRNLKMIIEMCDREVATYVYIVAPNTGKLVFLGHGFGYGIPASTQFTSPMKDIYHGTASTQHMAMPQADPDGLFSPASSDGTWMMMLNPETKESEPVYLEPRIIVSPFKFPTQ